MSTFQINGEIDKVVDRLTEEFKTRLKKLVIRSEKLVLKQYIASQKETMRVANRAKSRPKPKPKSQVKNGPNNKFYTKKVRKAPRREKDYEYEEFVSSEEDY